MSNNSLSNQSMAIITALVAWWLTSECGYVVQGVEGLGPGLSAGGHNVTRERFQVLATKIMSKLKSAARGISLANGKMILNKLQTVCTFRGDPLVNDPRL